MADHLLVMGPVEIWLAELGADFPAIDEEPDEYDWTLFGETTEIDEGGVTWNKTRTVAMQRTDGSSGPRDAFVTEEGITIEGTVVDMRLATVAKAYGNQEVTTQAAGAGTAGYESIGLYEGVGYAHKYAVLIRGKSPYAVGFTLQYQHPYAVFTGDLSTTWVKDNKAGVTFTIEVLEDHQAEDAGERFGVLIEQTEEAGEVI